jgi:hypothetical protein
VFRRLAVKLSPLTARYQEAAPAACCGVCKPCVTTAATGMVAGAVGLSIEAIAGRRSGREESGSREDRDQASSGEAL